MKKTADKLKLNSNDECPVERLVAVIGGRWKCSIIRQLLDGKRRFNELRRLIPNASQRMLTKHLRELERDGIVRREVYDQVPPKTEYSLTEVGRSLESLLWSLHEWTVENIDKSK